MNSSPAVSKPKSRLRRWLLALALGLGALAGLLLWCFHTAAGARFALSFAGDLLRYESISGSLAGPLVLSGVEFEAGGTKVAVAELALDPELWPLLRGELVLSSSNLKGVHVLLAAATEAANPEAPSTPISLPALQVRSLRLADARIEGVLAEAIVLESLQAAFTLKDQSVSVQELSWQMPQVKGSLTAQLELAKRQAQLDLELNPRLGPATMSTLRLQVQSDGSKGEAVLTLPGDGGQFRLSVGDLGGSRQFKARLDSPGLALAQFGFPGLPPIPALALNIEGDSGRAQLDGMVSLGGVGLALDGSVLRWSPEEIQFDPLQVAPALGGSLSAVGAIALQSQNANLQLVWRDLPLSRLLQDLPPKLSSSEGKLQLSGNLLQWQLAGPLKLNYREVPMAFDLDAQTDGKSLQLNQLGMVLGSAARPGGKLDLQGSMSLQAPYVLAATVTADAIDPAWFDPAWPGAVTLKAALEGPAGPGLVIELEQLSGTLREHSIAGKGQVRLAHEQGWPQLNAQLQWGGNEISLQSESDALLLADVSLRDLPIVDPELSGTLSGQLRWERSDGALRADLDGTALRYRDTEVANLSLQANLQLAEAASSRVQARLELTGAKHAGQELESLLLDLKGTQAAHTVDLAAVTPQLSAEFALQGGYLKANWQGQLQRLRLTPGLDAPVALQQQTWQLVAPAAIRVNVGANVTPRAASGSLGQLCLSHEQAELCAAGQLAADQSANLTLAVRAIPLQLADSALAAQGIQLRGLLNGGGTLARDSKGALSGQIEISADNSELTLEREEKPLKLRFKTLSLNAQPTAEGAMSATLSTDIEGLGTLTAAQAADGSQRISVDFAQLSALADLSPEVVNLRGSLRGELGIQGEAASGALRLIDTSVELPAAGLKLKGIEVEVRAEQGALAISGQLGSGAGVLKLNGTVDPRQWRRSLRLELQGENFLAVDLPQARAVISPQLVLKSRLLKGGASDFRLDGEIKIPEALLDLQQFEPSVQLSPDVIVVDEPVVPVTDLPLRSDLRFVLGENVQLRGFGLDGKLTGNLRLRERPDRPATARGEIAVTGTYKAYGQDLKIERGRLLFANSALDNPGLDIRAVRVVGRIKAGVQVRGPAELPELSTYSEPAMDQLNTISYLVLGRPASEARGAGGADVQNAAQQLGGNLLAKSVGQRLGLEVGIESSADLGGGSAFTVGKYLSPKLFVGYGKSLYDSAQLFIVRYRLSERYELEVLSGRELKGGINYRWER